MTLYSIVKYSVASHSIVWVDLGVRDGGVLEKQEIGGARSAPTLKNISQTMGSQILSFLLIVFLLCYRDMEGAPSILVVVSTRFCCLGSRVVMFWFFVDVGESAYRR